MADKTANNIQVEWFCYRCKAKHFGNCPKMKVTLTTTKLDGYTFNADYNDNNMANHIVNGGDNQGITPEHLQGIGNIVPGEDKTLDDDMTNTILVIIDKERSRYKVALAISKWHSAELNKAVKAGWVEGYHKGWQARKDNVDGKLSLSGDTQSKTPN